MVAENGFERAVARQQPGMAVASAKHLDRRLTVEHGRDDIAVLGVAPLDTPLKAFSKGDYKGYEFIDFR